MKKIIILAFILIPGLMICSNPKKHRMEHDDEGPDKKKQKVSDENDAKNNLNLKNYQDNDQLVGLVYNFHWFISNTDNIEIFNYISNFDKTLFEKPKYIGLEKQIQPITLTNNIFEKITTCSSIDSFLLTNNELVFGSVNESGIFRIPKTHNSNGLFNTASWNLSNSPTNCVLSKNGNYAATYNIINNKDIHLFNAKNVLNMGIIAMNDSRFTPNISLSNNGDLILIGYDNNSLDLYFTDINNSKLSLIKKIDDHKETIIKVILSGNGKYAVTISLDKIIFWNFYDLDNIKSFSMDNSQNKINNCVISEDGKRIILSNYYNAYLCNSILIHLLQDKQTIKKFFQGNYQHNISDIAISADGNYGSIITNKEKILYDLSDPDKIKGNIFEKGHEATFGISLSPNGDRALIKTQNGFSYYKFAPDSFEDLTIKQKLFIINLIKNGYSNDYKNNTDYQNFLKSFDEKSKQNLESLLKDDKYSVALVAKSALNNHLISDLAAVVISYLDSQYK